MIALLARIFIKENGFTVEEKRRGYGVLCGAVGIALNILLFAGKFFAGTISGSIAITADAFNNLSDAGSSAISLLGFRLAGQKPDPQHPFGHGRLEYVSGLFVAIAIVLMGFELGMSSIDKIRSPQPVEFSMLSVTILIISILVKFYMFTYNSQIGKRLDSPAMAATASDSLNDCIATGVVLLCTIAGRFTDLPLDGWCGIAVAAFILYSGYGAAKDTISPLLGQPPEKEFVDKIEQIVMSHDIVYGIHDLIVHDYGPGRMMISLHAEVPMNGNLVEMHDTIDNIEGDLRRELGCDAVIHMDPIETDNQAVSDTRKAVVDIVKGVDQSLTIHDFRMVSGPTHTNLIFDVVAPFSCKQADSSIKDAICNRIAGMPGDYRAVITIDKSYIM